MTDYFEGWYFKQQSAREMIAFIVAWHTRHGRKTGSVQIVTPDKSWFIELPGSDIAAGREALLIRAGDSTFSKDGLEVNIRGRDIAVTGRLSFGKPASPRGDIMGPYRFVPFMECRHSVFSLAHRVSGSLTVNGHCLDFTDGSGYIEGDRGRSFPGRYIWTQCIDDGKTTGHSGLCSLMLSVADVRPFGIPFIGIVGFVYFKGTEHRIATYRGAKLVSAGNGAVTVRQGDDTLTAQLLDGGANPHITGQVLRAPVSGDMARHIKESLKCRARYIFTRKERVLFDFVTEKASFEYEF
ncbi:MAG: hypothetical protein GX847_02675 [Clostridiales bacterium]|nr:hypothetical protein [Clostridiales bacterium]